MTRKRIESIYFDWIYGIVCGERFGRDISYRSLLTRLHDTEFIYIHPKDENRLYDGIDLRYRFEYYTGYDKNLIVRPCSVLEMMVALSFRIEEEIMDDPSLGDRTSQWFWNMIISLGLGSMDDARYDQRKVDEILERFIYREYSPNGEGGLFTIKRCDRDLRDVEIWYQKNWYLNSIL